MAENNETQVEPLRTEEEIIGQLAAIVIFGKKRYEIQPLVIKKAMAWRKQLSASINKYVNVSEGKLSLDLLSASNVLKLASAAFTEIPDVLYASVQQYAPDLPWKTIENEATSAQIIDAFKEIFGLEFPFLTSLDPAGITKVIASLQ